MLPPHSRKKVFAHLFQKAARSRREALSLSVESEIPLSFEKGRRGKSVAVATDLGNPPARRGSP